MKGDRRRGHVRGGDEGKGSNSGEWGGNEVWGMMGEGPGVVWERGGMCEEVGGV